MTVCRVLRRRTAALAVVGILLAAGFTGATAGAAPPTSDGPTAAGYGAGWLAARVTAEGFVPDELGDPVPGDTLLTALALATAQVDEATFDRTVDWLADHVDEVTGTGADTSPGQIGYLLLVVDAADLDATNFGGVDLVTRLNDTLGDLEAGLYGAGFPNYDAAFRQSFAILGLEAVGVTPPQAAIDWLVAQQCGTADAAVRGAWQAYRAPAEACLAPDLNNFVGVDTNSTAAAVEALAAAGVTPPVDPLPWIDAAQNATGGWGFFPGLDDDPNSTALMIQALVAAEAGPGDEAVSALLAFQLGCDADPLDQGAFTYPGSDDAPNALATQQAVWGAMEQAFPLPEITFGDAPVPCQPEPTTTTTAGSTPTTADPAGPATPVAAQAAFTG